MKIQLAFFNIYFKRGKTNILLKMKNRNLFNVATVCIQNLHNAAARNSISINKYRKKSF